MNESEIDLLHPDSLRLDQEWANQPRLRRKYGEDLAEAQREVAQAKADLDVVKADTDNLMRTTPEDFGLIKVTEPAIKAAILSHPRVKKAEQRVIDATYRVNMISASVNAIDHRKKALEKLVDLFLSDYFGSPRAPVAAREQIESTQKEIVRGRGRDRRKENWEEEGDDS